MDGASNGAADREDRSMARIRGLVEQAQSGDREALGTLFTLHEPMLVRWARRRLGQSLRTLDETRDVLHDAFSIAVDRIQGFHMEDSRSLARWLRGIVTRVILRKAGSPYLVRRRAFGNVDPQDLELTPMTRLSVEELRDLRYRILRQQPRQDRIVYRLKARGWSSTDIANRMGVTDRAVRLSFARTDAKIRLRMRRYVDGVS